MRFALAMLAVAVSAVAVMAQRPATETIPATGGDITIVPVRHGTVEIVHANHVILVDPARNWDDPPFDAPPPPPPPPAGSGARGRQAVVEPPPPPPGTPPRPPSAATLNLYAGLIKPSHILVTDIHDDHLAPELIAMLRTGATQVVIPAAARDQVKDGVVIANGETKSVGGVSIEAVPMYNLAPDPKFGMTFHTKGRGNGYVVALGGKRLYFAGDTACTPEMKALKNIDVAFLPMNLPFTMSPEDAAQCAKAFMPKIVYPYHYWGMDPDRGEARKFAELMKGSAIDVRVRDWYVGVPARPQ